jgi:hypothetical protein
MENSEILMGKFVEIVMELVPHVRKNLIPIAQVAVVHYSSLKIAVKKYAQEELIPMMTTINVSHAMMNVKLAVELIKTTVLAAKQALIWKEALV